MNPKWSKIVYLVFIVVTVFEVGSESIFCKDECKKSGIRCADPYTYQLCTNMSDYAVGSTSPKQCPAGTICDDVGSFPCRKGTVPTTTTIPEPTTLPPCSGPSKFPTSSCNTYFQCVQSLWWWEPKVQTCPDGENFNPATSECVSSDLYKCPSSTGTTASPEETKCTGSGRLPGPSPSQYYECEFIWFQWQPQLKTCPTEQLFDQTAAECTS